MDTPEYETVWNGGPGLTTVGAQRLNAVLRDQTEGDVSDWIDGTPVHTCTVYDVADTPHFVTRWLIVDACKKWDRLVRFARWVPWPTCHFCGQSAERKYALKNHRRRRSLGRTFYTPYHRSACQSCYVLYRMSRGRWPAAARWRYLQVSAEERLTRRRASRNRYYYRQKAARLAAAALGSGAVFPPAPTAHTPPASE